MSWYYAAAGQQKGPVSDAELEGLYQSGTIQADTLVWEEGMPDWKPYAQVKGGGAPPPEGGVVCNECRQIFPPDEVISYGDVRVCAKCKPVFVQRLKEGATVPGTMDYASFGTRFGAKILDSLILWVVNFAIGLVAGSMIGKQGTGGAFVAGQLVITAISFMINLGYTIFFLGKFGATPGKMACKIRVVTPEGGKISFGRAAGRGLSEILSGLICSIGYIMAGFDDQKRALHDRLANTRVIKN